jgi:hypothetical protein
VRLGRSCAIRAVHVHALVVRLLREFHLAKRTTVSLVFAMLATQPGRPGLAHIPAELVGDLGYGRTPTAVTFWSTPRNIGTILAVISKRFQEIAVLLSENSLENDSIRGYRLGATLEKLDSTIWQRHLMCGACHAPAPSPPHTGDMGEDNEDYHSCRHAAHWHQLR